MKDVVFAKIDVDQAEDLADSNGVDAMPTFIFYRNGQTVGTYKGSDEEMLRNAIAPFHK